MKEKIVKPGVNTVQCDCGDGTVFVPVNMHLMAKLRHGGTYDFSGQCHLGHIQKIKLMAREPIITRA